MKKIFAMMMLAAATSTAFAQAGEKSIGVGLSYGSKIETLGIGAKFQYNVADPVRVEFGGDYWLKKDGVSFWDLNLNAHYLIDVAENIKSILLPVYIPAWFY